ncbi:exonuclease V [Baffinella frigidus]|nr:exonuclease V [Cryptophyta sp. CCMP2293]
MLRGGDGEDTWEEVDGGDIEDLASPLELHRKRGRKAVFVTELVAQEWCEMALDLTLRKDKGRVQQTAQMAAGSERHEEVEREVHTHVRVPVKTKEDTHAIKLINLKSAAHQLCTQGIAREVPVFGYVGGAEGEEGLWIAGIIDELAMEEGPGPGESCVVVRELKTRNNPTMPSAAQQRGTALQLMLYKTLWDRMVLPGGGIDGAGLALQNRLDLNKPLSPECAASLASLGSTATSLTQILEALAFCPTIDPTMHEALAFCPTIYPTMHVRYEHLSQSSAGQQVARLLGEQHVKHDSKALTYSLARQLPFWRGLAAPRGVTLNSDGNVLASEGWREWSVHASPQRLLELGEDV